MKFKMIHNNLNVLDLKKSVAFYQEALGLTEVRRHEAPGFTLVYLADGASGHELELTWLKDRTEPYDLGDNEIHLAFETDDFAAAHAKHVQRGGEPCHDLFARPLRQKSLQPRGMPNGMLQGRGLFVFCCGGRQSRRGIIGRYPGPDRFFQDKIVYIAPESFTLSLSMV